MKRHVFYDDTGRILHTHAVVSAEGHVREDASEGELAVMVGRMVDTSRTRSVLTELSPASSRAVAWRVDRKTGELQAERITRPARPERGGHAPERS